MGQKRIFILFYFINPVDFSDLQDSRIETSDWIRTKSTDSVHQDGRIISNSVEPQRGWLGLFCFSECHRLVLVLTELLSWIFSALLYRTEPVWFWIRFGFYMFTCNEHGARYFSTSEWLDETGSANASPTCCCTPLEHGTAGFGSGRRRSFDPLHSHCSSDQDS